MKKLCILLAALCLLSSCSQSSNTPTRRPDNTPDNLNYTEIKDDPVTGNIVGFYEDMQYTDGILYFFSEGVLQRLICSTGNVTTVCPDPLCMHDTSACPLYKVDSYVAAPDGNIYINQQYGDVRLNALGENIGVDHVAHYARFDPVSTKKKVYFSYISEDTDSLSLFISDEVFTDQYRIYKDYMADEKGVWHAALIRMNLESGEREFLESYSSGETQGDLITSVPFPGFLYGDSEKLILLGDDGIYSLSMDGKSRETILTEIPTSNSYLSDGKNLFYQKSDTLCTIPLSGGEEKVVAENVYTWNMTENYIYFWTNDEVNLGEIDIKGYLANELILYGSTLMRCKHNGSGLTEVFTFNGDYENARAGSWLAAGNYVYMTYSKWSDTDGDGVFEDGDEFRSDYRRATVLLRLDTATGELIEIHAK